LAFLASYHRLFPLGEEAVNASRCVLPIPTATRVRLDKLAMAEEAALRLRLQAKEVALRSLTKKYLAFSNAIEKSSVEECEAMHEALILEIKTYEFSISKGSLLVDTNVQQVAEYDAMQQDVEAMMCAPPVEHHRLSSCLTVLL
jgi:hypothetical protein